MPAIDNFCIQMDIRPMLRRALAVLLVLLWVILSGVDVLEDLDLPRGIEVQSSTDVPPRESGQIGRLANNIVESADHSRAFCSGFLEQATVHLAFEAPIVFHKTTKLHKLHRVFLI